MHCPSQCHAMLHADCDTTGYLQILNRVLRTPLKLLFKMAKATTLILHITEDRVYADLFQQPMCKQPEMPVPMEIG